MVRINLRSFTRQSDCVRVGGFTYLPHAPTYSQLQKGVTQLFRHQNGLPEDLVRELSQLARGQRTPLFVTPRVLRAAQDGMEWLKGSPPWTERLPSAFRRYLGVHWGLTESSENPICVPHFVFSGLGGYVVDLGHSLMGGAFRNFNLPRLGQIRQLGWLGVPLLSMDLPEGHTLIRVPCEHNRLTHVWDVAALANLIGHAASLAPEDVATLVLAAATHDARTPAGGDTTKFLDPAALDEDRNYPELLMRFNADAFLGSHGIVRERLIAAVQGQGLLGALLDIADKTAYVARDAWAYDRRFGDIVASEEQETVHALLHARGDACGAWQSLTVRDGVPVFTDPEGLARFLHLRALLFRGFYHHPAARFTECIVSYLVLRHLVDTQQISLRDLLEWTDPELDHRIRQFMRPGYGVDFGEPRYEGYDDLASAERRRAELLATGERCVMIEPWYPQIKTGTDWLVVQRRGPARPLRECAPSLAAPIDALARVIKPFRLYWVARAELPSELLAILP